MRREPSEVPQGSFVALKCNGGDKTVLFRMEGDASPEKSEPMKRIPAPRFLSSTVEGFLQLSLGLLAAGTLVCTPSSTQAQTDEWWLEEPWQDEFRVDTLEDENDGIDQGGVSLREAILASQSGNPFPPRRGARIFFSPDFAHLDDPPMIHLALGELVIDQRTIFIDASEVEGGVTISGQGLHRVLNIGSDSKVMMDSVHITGGQAGVGRHGGGVLNEGKLFARNANIFSNIAAPR